MLNHSGELFAFLTAICWTITSLSFEAAGKRVGSLPVNLIRLVFAFFYLTLFSGITRGYPLPSDASSHNWLWLSLSGFVGFLLADLCLFRAFVIIGARISMLIMSLVPIFSAISGFLLINERIGLTEVTGMIVTIFGVIIVILKRKPNTNKISLAHSLEGILLALCAAICQASGLVLSKFGMGNYNSFSATQIRSITGIIGFAIIISLNHRWSRVTQAFKDIKAMKTIILGSVFGPFLGVSFSLLSVRYIETGVATTIIAIVPVLIIIPAILLFKEKVTVKEVIGAFIAILGIGILFLR